MEILKKEKKYGKRNSENNMRWFDKVSTFVLNKTVLKASIVLTLSLIIFVISLAVALATDYPTLVGFHGRLTDTSGNAITQCGIQINISNGTQVFWGPYNFSNATDSNGVFTIILGSTYPLNMSPGRVYNLTVAVDNNTETFSSGDVTYGDNSPAGDLIYVSGGAVSDASQLMLSGGTSNVETEIGNRVNKTGDFMTGGLNITGGLNVSSDLNFYGAISGPIGCGNITGGPDANFCTDTDTNTNCSAAGSCTSVAYLNYNNPGNMTINGNLSTTGNASITGSVDIAGRLAVNNEAEAKNITLKPAGTNETAIYLISPTGTIPFNITTNGNVYANGGLYTDGGISGNTINANTNIVAGGNVQAGKFTFKSSNNYIGLTGTDAIWYVDSTAGDNASLQYSPSKKEWIFYYEASKHVTIGKGYVQFINTTAPACSSTTTGRIYYDTATNKHYGCNSTAWNALY